MQKHQKFKATLSYRKPCHQKLSKTLPLTGFETFELSSWNGKLLIRIGIIIMPASQDCEGTLINVDKAYRTLAGTLHLLATIYTVNKNLKDVHFCQGFLSLYRMDHLITEFLLIFSFFCSFKQKFA